MKLPLPPLFFLLQLLTFASILALAPPSAAAAAASPSLFVLGDSSVNCGVNTFFSPLLSSTTPTFASSPSCPLLLHDLIAEKMGLPPVIPFYESNGMANSGSSRFLAKGVNFGSVDGTIIVGGSASFLFQGLHRQVTMVFDTIQVLQLELGWERAQEIVSEAVFWVSFGTDDYVDLIMQDSSDLVPKYGRRGFARILIPQVIQALEDLYNGGARKIVVVGLPPLGCSPWAVFDRKNCVDEVNDLVRDYNAFLFDGIRDLNVELPDASLVFCDVYVAMMEIMSHPRRYGFEDGSNACCGLKSFVGMVGCLSEQMACGSPSSYIWWDLYSPSTAVNTLIANWSWSGKGHWRICHSISLGPLTSNI